MTFAREEGGYHGLTDCLQTVEQLPVSTTIAGTKSNRAPF
jgi:hypothetical protein